MERFKVSFDVLLYILKLLFNILNLKANMFCTNRFFVQWISVFPTEAKCTECSESVANLLFWYIRVRARWFKIYYFKTSNDTNNFKFKRKSIDRDYVIFFVWPLYNLDSNISINISRPMNLMWNIEIHCISDYIY